MIGIFTFDLADKVIVFLLIEFFRSGSPVRKTTPESVKQLVKTPAIESSESMEKSEEGISNISERKFTENSHQGVSESGSITVNGPSTVVNELTG